MKGNEAGVCIIPLASELAGIVPICPSSGCWVD